MFLVQSLTSVLYVPSYKGNDAQDIEHELDYCSVEMYSHKCRITGIAIHSSLTKHRLLNSFQSKEKQKERRLLGPASVPSIEYHQSHTLSVTKIVIEMCVVSVF